MSGDVKIDPVQSSAPEDESNVCKSPLLLERSETEFRRQVDVVYETKMIPRPTSGISGKSFSLIHNGGSICAATAGIFC